MVPSASVQGDLAHRLAVREEAVEIDRQVLGEQDDVEPLGPIEKRHRGHEHALANPDPANKTGSPPSEPAIEERRGRRWQPEDVADVAGAKIEDADGLKPERAEAASVGGGPDVPTPGVFRQCNGRIAREVRRPQPRHSPSVASVVGRGQCRIREGAIPWDVAEDSPAKWPDESFDPTPVGCGDDHGVLAVVVRPGRRHWRRAAHRPLGVSAPHGQPFVPWSELFEPWPMSDSPWPPEPEPLLLPQSPLPVTWLEPCPPLIPELLPVPEP